jgi:hypothetical protein
MFHRASSLLIALALAATCSLAAQADLTLAAGANQSGPMRIVNRALLAAALKPVYTVELRSDWPQLGLAGGDCVNGGQEVLKGTIELTSGGNYVGSLQRGATIRFCGAHGQAQEACALTLTSTGPVAATGEVQPFTRGWTNPVVELHWATAAAGTAVRLDGDCAPAFNDALRRMYLGVTHMVEFPLPAAGEGLRRAELADYGWIVEVQ